MAAAKTLASASASPAGPTAASPAHAVPPAAAASSSPGVFAAPVLAAALAVFGILAVHGATSLSIVSIWVRSETFAHGFVILPLCAWLIWRKREVLREVPARPWWPGLLLVLLFGAMWLVTTAADTLGLQQFALAFMVQAAFVTVVGLRVARVLAFPIAFFLFAVPVGEMFVPTLIDWTADFTVAALRLSGVPVYREANDFVIPSGAWSVVEACSGIRYIIASVMIGTIYSAIAYRSWRPRAMFMVAAIVTPIVANWLRAYMIVMLGHLSDNRIAAGVDHIIYGWFFFGIVMLLLFWIAGRWQEAPASDVERAAPATTAPVFRAAGRGGLFAAAAACVLAAGMWVPIGHVVARADVRPASTAASIPTPEGWTLSSHAGAAWAPHYGGYDWSSSQVFARDGQEVGVFLAYYRGQTKGREMVTSSNALIRLDDNAWKRLSRVPVSIDWTGRDVPVDVVQIVGRSVAFDAVELFWVDGRFTASRYVAKALIAWSRLRGRGDDAALVVLYVQRPRDAAPRIAALQDFARVASPDIGRALEDVRGQP